VLLLVRDDARVAVRVVVEPSSPSRQRSVVARVLELEYVP
jgi:hypothetical protein